MPRSVDDWGSIGSTLARVLTKAPPSWVHPATAMLVEAALVALRRDALAAIAGVTTRGAPGALGMGRTALMAARAPGGWLAAHGPNATLTEVWGEATPSLRGPAPASSPRRVGGRRS